MYISLDPATILSSEEIVGIFDLDHTSQSYRTRAFLDQAEKDGVLTTVGEDLPKSLVVCAPPWGGQRVFLVQAASATLKGRILKQTMAPELIAP